MTLKCLLSASARCCAVLGLGWFSHAAFAEPGNLTTVDSSVAGASSGFDLTNKIYVAIGLGYDQVKIADTVVVQGIKQSDFNSYNADINVAYYPIEKLRFEAGGFKGSSFNVLSANDQVRLSGTYVAFGPSLLVGNYVEIAPQVGWVDWKLELKEGQFLNFGPGNTETFRGNDRYLGVSIGWDAFYFRYRYFDQNISNVSSMSLGFELRTR